MYTQAKFHFINFYPSPFLVSFYDDVILPSVLCVPSFWWRIPFPPLGRDESTKKGNCPLGQTTPKWTTEWEREGLAWWSNVNREEEEGEGELQVRLR